jgi:hypothetical protein
MKMRKLLYLSFPFYLNDEFKNVLLVVFTSIFVIIFLFIYEPFQVFNVGQTPTQVWVAGLITLGVLLIHLHLLPKLFPVLFEPADWTILKYILFNAWLLLCIGLTNTMVNLLFFCSAKPVFEIVFYTNLQVVLIGIFPLFFVTFLVRNQMLAENLRNALLANQKIEAIQTFDTEKDSEITLQTETSETLFLKLNDFIFAEAQNNYAMVYFYHKKSFTKRLLRLTLKNLETQFNNQFFIRCHRSYLVNVKAIHKIKGNGYKLIMQDNPVEIPVSRAKGKEIIQQIQEIKDVLDIL